MGKSRTGESRRFVRAVLHSRMNGEGGGEGSVEWMVDKHVVRACVGRYLFS
jgi:hypothetical protein